MERPASSTLPTTPGIYIYKDAQGRIIYVGKSRNLRKRILSYFRDASALTPKTVAMIGHAASLETLSTTTEKEALLLEASLIKKHRPHYNIVLRDDKQYVLFRIAKDAPYPRLEVVRQARRDNARYFGPFTSGQAARETWKSIHRVFPLRRCVDRAFKNRVRPCLYHHIGQCLAPCTENVPVEEYASLIHRVELLLSGRSRELLDTLRHAMEDASEAMNYEQAAVFRDQIKAIERTVERQSVVLPEGGNMDVAGVAPAKGGLALGLLFVREGRLVDGRTFFWPDLELAEGPELLWSFLGQFYGPQTSIPPRIVVPWLPEDTVLPGMSGEHGVQVATRFVTTEECDADIRYKEAYIQAEKEDIAIVKSPVGMPGRAVLNPFMKRVAKGEQIPHSPCHGCLAKCSPATIPYCITDGLIEAVKGNIENGLVFCGAKAWKARRIDTVKEVVESLFAVV